MLLPPASQDVRDSRCSHRFHGPAGGARQKKKVFLARHVVLHVGFKFFEHQLCSPEKARHHFGPGELGVGVWLEQIEPHEHVVC